jgi:ferric-dicitrate binding protein FerR (iron transport regulator)
LKTSRLLLLLLGFPAWIACSSGNGPSPAGPETPGRSFRPHPVRLADGSELLADSGSTVRVSPAFNRSDRDIFLDGEAFIRPAAGDRAFVVHTRALHITVLKDTVPAAFLVSAFSKSNGEEVDVQRGRLQIRKSYPSRTDSAAELIGTGEMLMINTEIDLMEKETADSATLERMKRFSRN